MNKSYATDVDKIFKFFYKMIFYFSGKRTPPDRISRAGNNANFYF